jgi:hypothetical protein
MNNNSKKPPVSGYLHHPILGDIPIVPTQFVINDGGPILCVAVKHAESSGVPGAQQRPCAICSQSVWVSPGSLKISAEGNNPLLCIECVGQLTKKCG